MEKKYILNENSNVIIYGSATMGSMLVDRLHKANIVVKGFIDKRAYEIKELKGYKVWSIDDHELNENIDESTVIIIAVKNVFIHKEIIDTLIKNTSCRKYIYVPFGTTDQEIITKNVFNTLFYEDINLPYELEEVKDIKLNCFQRADNRKEIENKVVLLVPTGMIFTNNVSKEQTIWGDIPILGYFPHIRLFQFFANEENGDIKSYLEFCITASKDMQILQSEAWMNNIIENRKNVYDQMLNEYDLSSDFFYLNAPTAKWNDKGYFNLTSGKHRAIFLISKGCRYIPLKISLSDEEKWLNSVKAEKLFNKLEAIGIASITYSIDNPYFYRYLNCSGALWNNVLSKIVCQLSEYLYDRYKTVSFEKIRVLNLYNDNKYILRYLFKMGARVVDLVDNDDIENDIDELLHCNYSPLRKEEDIFYDLLIAKSVSSDIIANREIKNIICEEYTIECNRATKFGNVIGNDGIRNIYFIEL